MKTNLKNQRSRSLFQALLSNYQLSKSLLCTKNVCKVFPLQFISGYKKSSPCALPDSTEHKECKTEREVSLNVRIRCISLSNPCPMFSIEHTLQLLHAYLEQVYHSPCLEYHLFKFKIKIMAYKILLSFINRSALIGDYYKRLFKIIFFTRGFSQCV